MIKKLILLILPLYLSWPPNAAACNVGGKDILNFKSRTTHLNGLAPVPYEGNEQAYGNTSTQVATVAVESTRRISPLRREMQSLEGKAVDESKKDDSSVDLTELDGMTVVVPSGSAGTK